MQYDERSVEFRLIGWYLFYEKEYHRSCTNVVLQRLLDLFFVLSSGKFTEDSVSKYIKSAAHQAELLYDFNPFSKTQDEDQEEANAVSKKVPDEQLYTYLDTLNSQGSFSSFEQLLSAVEGMKEAINELNTRDENVNTTAD